MSIVLPTLRAQPIVNAPTGTWTPDQLDPAALKVWLRGDDTPPQATVDFPQWADKRGAPIFYRNSTVNAVRQDAALNGHRIVVGTAAGGKPWFDGTTECAGHLRNAASAFGLAVFRVTAAVATTQFLPIFYSILPNTGSTRFGVNCRSDEADYTVIYRRLDTDPATVLGGGPRQLNTWVMFGGMVDWAGGNIYTTNNGAVMNGTYALTVGNTEDTDSLVVQSVGHVSVNYYGDGDLAEVLLVSPRPGDDDERRCEGYMAWRFGMEGLLPAGHPYKSGAP